MSTRTDAVALLSLIDDHDGQARFYTEVHGGFTVGDTVFISVRNTGSTDYTLLDSFYKASLSSYCASALVGYTVSVVIDNAVVLDLPYTEVSSASVTSGNCFMSKIACADIVFDAGTINGVTIKRGTINSGGVFEDIQWTQAVVMDVIPGGTIEQVNFGLKYTSNDLTLNCKLEDGRPVHYYTYNNHFHGTTVVGVSPVSPILLDQCEFDGGWFSECEVEGRTTFTLSPIRGGNFLSCDLTKCIVSGGEIVDSRLDTYCLWEGGTWSNGILTDNTDVGNAFAPLVWGGGTWDRGIFPPTAEWHGGIFNDGTLEDGTRNTFKAISWRNGIFNGGTFRGLEWLSGSFNRGVFETGTWWGGDFNNDAVFGSNGVWKNGTFNSGAFAGASWFDGTFNGGEFTGSTWINGIFNDGTFRGSSWEDGTFNGGTFIDSSWERGDFYGGVLLDSTWQDGQFHQGTFEDSDWSGGDFRYGKMARCTWLDGTWHNGTCSSTDFVGGTWDRGVYSGGNVAASVTWRDGSFNSGTFNGTWLNGRFYGGTFDGSWTRGTFYCGSDPGNVIPDSDKAGGCFQPYKKEDIVRKMR